MKTSPYRASGYFSSGKDRAIIQASDLPVVVYPEPGE